MVFPKCTGADHELRNRYLLIHSDQIFQSAKNAQGVSENASKCKNCTLEELAVLNILKSDPSMTQKALAERIGKSERTVKTITVSLQKKGMLERMNGKWIVLS